MDDAPRASQTKRLQFTRGFRDFLEPAIALQSAIDVPAFQRDFSRTFPALGNRSSESFREQAGCPTLVSFIKS